MTSPPAPSSGPDLSWLGKGAWGTFLYGGPRPVLLRVLYAMARAVDEAPFWLEIREPHGRTESAGPAELGWIPEERLYLTEPEETKPQDGVGNMALWAVVRSDEPSAVVTQLTDFLRLPARVQEAISQLGDPADRRVFAVANTDRVRGYYPNAPGKVRPVIDAFLGAGAVPIFGSEGEPGAGRTDFDFVFEVRAPDLARWAEGTLFCEKAPAGTPFRSGTSLRLADLRGVPEALTASKEPPRPAPDASSRP